MHVSRIIIPRNRLNFIAPRMQCSLKRQSWDIVIVIIGMQLKTASSTLTYNHNTCTLHQTYHMHKHIKTRTHQLVHIWIKCTMQNQQQSSHYRLVTKMSIPHSAVADLNAQQILAYTFMLYFDPMITIQETIHYARIIELVARDKHIFFWRTLNLVCQRTVFTCHHTLPNSPGVA